MKRASRSGFPSRWAWLTWAGLMAGVVACASGVTRVGAADTGETEDDPGVGQPLAQRFRELTRAARWDKVTEVRLSFRTYHPQGMSVVGDRFFLSSVEVLDRAAGQGNGHLFEVGFDGRLRRHVHLGEGAMYHPGGVDFDGRWLWVPVAEYRPDSRTLVYRVNPADLTVERVFEFPDHLGALVSDRSARRLVGVSWGSRRFYQWELDPEGRAPLEPGLSRTELNGSHYVDYQDGQSLAGTRWALFGGVSRLGRAGEAGWALGALELVDTVEMRAVHQLPVPLWTKQGQSLLQNPMAVQIAEEGLRCFFVPEDDDSTLYIYQVVAGR